LAREGARLVLADAARATALEEQLKAFGAAVLDIPTDVCDADAIRSLVAKTHAAFGRIDILVTVAGVTSLGSAEDLSEAEWDRVLAVNLKGAFLSCQAVIAQMRQQGFGRIINIGSIVAKNGGNGRPWIARDEQAQTGNVAYGVSKAGVHALTYYLAKELASDGITVNAVAPGPIASIMTRSFPDSLRKLIPVGRLGAPDDVAEAVSFLAAENSSFITGEVLDVNGGMLMD
jgi:NAD(P)-dependent dehydrogenase (short-subunit alcohol dehydrogenase family)